MYCCWEYDHRDRTLEFLDRIDCHYFGTVAAMLAEHLSSEAEMAASIALRATYQQGIEALMSLLGAIAQAPEAVPAWIAKCSTNDLKDVVRRPHDGRSMLTQAGWRRVTFDELSTWTHRSCWTDETGDESTAARFGRFWTRLAGEILDEVARAEYNAIKHGNRVSAGGFHMAVGVEKQPGVQAPPEAMRSLGGSRYGTTFFAAEPVGNAKWHIRSRRTSINWSADALTQRLALVSMSINNVVGALRCAFGTDPTTQLFERPTPISAFDDVWANEPAIRHTNMDRYLRIRSEDELSRADLRANLERR